MLIELDPPPPSSPLLLIYTMSHDRQHRVHGAPLTYCLLAYCCFQEAI